MFLIWLLTGIFNSANVLQPDSGNLWHWFGHHVIVTILMLIFLA